MAGHDVRTEAFAMASFILQVNTLRTLVLKRVLSQDEAIEVIDEARRQLDQLIAANRADRTAMLDRELLDYEAIFRDIDDRAAEDLLRTLREALEQILDAPSMDYDFDGDRGRGAYDGTAHGPASSAPPRRSWADVDPVQTNPPDGSEEGNGGWDGDEGRDEEGDQAIDGRTNPAPSDASRMEPEAGGWAPGAPFGEPARDPDMAPDTVGAADAGLAQANWPEAASVRMELEETEPDALGPDADDGLDIPPVAATTRQATDRRDLLKNLQGDPGDHTPVRAADVVADFVDTLYGASREPTSSSVPGDILMLDDLDFLADLDLSPEGGDSGDTVTGPDGGMPDEDIPNPFHRRRSDS